MVVTARRENFDLEGIAWNYYGAYPFIGLGKLEFDFGVLNFFQKYFLQRVNPKQSARLYHEQVTNLKALYPDKKLLLAEWNIVVGATDERVHNHENGAFTASSLSAMQDAGLDDAHAYSLHFGSYANDGGDTANQELAGMMNDDGTTDQRWQAFLMWSELGNEELPTYFGVNQPSHDVWSTVSRHSNGDVSVLVSNYRAVPRFQDGYPIAIRLDNFNQSNDTVISYWIEPGMDDNDAPIENHIEVKKQFGATTAEFFMKNQSVVLLHFTSDYVN